MQQLTKLLLTIGFFAAQTVYAGPAYQFDAVVQTLPSTDHPLWAGMLTRHQSERAVLQNCLDDRKSCPRHLRGLRRLLNRADGLNPHAQIVLINRFFNKRRYVVDATDPEVGAGYWHTLTHFLRDGGDCEDYAIAKYFALRYLGFEKQNLRVVISYDTHARDFHAMLAVHLDGRSHFLENDNTVLRGGEQRTYAVSYAINEDHWWDHGMAQISRRYSKSL